MLLLVRICPPAFKGDVSCLLYSLVLLYCLRRAVDSFTTLKIAGSHLHVSVIHSTLLQVACNAMLTSYAASV